MVTRFRRLMAAMAIGSLSASLFLAAPTAALAKSSATTCWGGPIAGSYANLLIAGTCFTAAPVSVSGNLTVAANGILYAAFSGDTVSVGGNLSVGTNAVLVLGCEPEAFPCLDDAPPFTTSASFHIGGNLVADGALAVLVHNGSVGHNLALTGGGGGVNCDPQPALMGFPAYASFEDVSIYGGVSISGWQSCWLGIFRTSIGGNLNFSGNNTFDPDGNEVATNTIGGNLNCAGNSPAPQIGDSGGAFNSVGRKATGQCVGLVP